MNQKIVFCGGGNMAEGILRSLLNANTVAAENITVNELLPARCDYLSKTYGITALTDAAEAMKNADIAIIAVIPKHVPTVAATLKPLLKDSATVISIAAGIKLETLEGYLGADRKIIRATPNTLNQAGSGYSAICPNANCDEADKALAEELFGALGQVMPLREELFNAFTAYSNVGPLWLYKMVEAMTDAGVYLGFSRADARKIAIANMKGAAQVLDITGEHPTLKVEEMASPGGVTIESLRALQSEGFNNVIMNAAIAGYNKVNNL